MKKMISVLLAVLMLCLPMAAGLAEAAEQESGFESWLVGQAALAAAAMQGKLEPQLLKTYDSIAATRIAGTDYSATIPVKYGVIRADAQQAQKVLALLGCGGGEMAQSLAFLINQMVRYPEFAAQASKAALVNVPLDYEGEDLPGEGIVVLMLCYQADLVVVAADCAGKQMSASFILSDERSNKQLNEAALANYMTMLGVSDAEIVMHKVEMPGDPAKSYFVNLTIEAARAMHAGFSGEGLQGYEKTACNRIGSTEYGTDGAEPVKCAYIRVSDQQMQVLKAATYAGGGEIARVFANLLNTQGFSGFAEQAYKAALVNQPFEYDGELNAAGIMVLVCFKEDLVALLADCSEKVYGSSFIISDRNTARRFTKEMLAEYAKQVGISDFVDAEILDY